MANINEKLNEIQVRLKAPKGQYNSFGKYSYRSCEDILEAVKPLLASTSTTLTIDDDILMVGNRIYIKATATLRDCESGETVTASAFAREPNERKGMDEAQVTGSSSSYARKYALNGLLAIDDNKDADTNEARAAVNNAPVSEYVCPDCGTPYRDVTAGGKCYTAEQIYNIRKNANTDGAARCKKCAAEKGTEKSK